MKTSIGSRLKEERNRLGLSQEEFAALAGASKGVQLKWEKDVSSPTATMLEAFARWGVDTDYIVTGKRAEPVAEFLIKDDLDAIRRNLLDTQPRLLPDETPEAAERRIVEGSKGRLAAILHYDRALMSPELAQRATELLSIASDPTQLKRFRAADFAENRLKREVLKADLSEYLEGAPYVPSPVVTNMLVTLALNYEVPVKFIAEILWEVVDEITPISEQKPRSVD